MCIVYCICVLCSDLHCKTLTNYTFNKLHYTTTNSIDNMKSTIMVLANAVKVVVITELLIGYQTVMVVAITDKYHKNGSEVDKFIFK